MTYKTPEQIAEAIAMPYEGDHYWVAESSALSAIETDRAQRPRTLLGDAYYERIENAIRLAFEGQGEAWSDRLSGDRLARVARDAIEEAGL